MKKLFRCLRFFVHALAGAALAATAVVAEARQVFVDGFESGDLVFGAWENEQADVQREFRAAGACAARLQATDAIVKSFPTPGLTEIVLRYQRATRRFEANEDFFFSEWFDGREWHALETLTGTAETFTAQRFALPAAAGNNPNFKIRFRARCGVFDFAYIDEVKIEATCAAAAEPDVPHVTHVGLVSPAIVQLSVGEQQVIPGPQTPYVAEPGDEIAQPNPPETPHRFVRRRGAAIGTLVGPKNDTLWSWDLVTGLALDPVWADAPASYRLSSADDPAYATPVAPVTVHRKTKPSGYARAGESRHEVTVAHELFLRFPKELRPGARYTIGFAGAPSAAGVLAPQSFVCDPARLRSPAVHVSQLGFHPDDPAKVAFLSTWLGSGGPLDYVAGTPFAVLDDATGRAVFSGRIALQKAATAAEIGSMFGAKNTNRTNVYQMDFSALREPGRYRVSVAGIGCSYPFTIGADVWESAFKVSVKGLYQQRSGIALTAPYTNAPRPRDHHPDDGVVVRLTNTPLIDGPNGLDNSQPNNFVSLVAGLRAPEEKLGREAWGGYHDAGDWDRRIQHLEASIWLLTLAEEFPRYFGALSLTLPESGNGCPDVVNEALWNIDFYRRLQIASGPDAGGVRGGIEHDAHPRLGEASWQDTNLTMTYAPDPWSSYWYAGSAAMAAHWLAAHGSAEPAAVYRRSASDAYRWAVAQDLARYRMGGKKEVTDARNFAAAALFRLTGAAEYHADFVRTTDFAHGVAATSGQRYGSWTYARTKRDGVNAAIQANIVASYVADANTLVQGCNDTGFRWTMSPKWLYGVGVFSTSLESPTLVKAHLLTGDPVYLATLVLSCQTGAGANPDNRCYTTGLGANPVLHPLDADSRYFRDMATPHGLTTLGPADFSIGLSMGVFAPRYWPESTQWPIIECYHDVWLDPMLTEYTVHHPITQNFVAWGYLAAVHAAERERAAR